MSAEKRRNVLVVFGGVAIVAAAALVSISPNFPGRGDDAVGAIGAVQKHRAPQISAQDVILGDETVKRQENTLYGDFLRDSARLRASSAQLAAFVANRDQSAASRDELQQFARDLAGHQADLQNRYGLAMKDMLAQIDQAGSEALSNAMKLEAAALGLRSNMENKRLAAVAQIANSDAQAVNARMIENINSDVAAAFAAVENKTALSNENMLAAASRLQSAADAIANEAALNRIAMYARYVNAAANLSSKLQNVEQQVSAAASLQNAEALSARMANAAESLGVEASQLESQALENMNNRLAQRTALANAFLNLEAMMAKGQLAAAALENEAASAYNKALFHFQGQMQNRQSQMNARLASEAQAELAAISAHLSNVEQASARIAQRTNLAAMTNNRAVAAAAAAENRSQAEARMASEAALSSRLANAESFASHLAALSKSLENRHLGRAALQNSDALQSQAEALMNRAAQLNSRAQ